MPAERTNAVAGALLLSIRAQAGSLAIFLLPARQINQLDEHIEA